MQIAEAASVGWCLVPCGIRMLASAIQYAALFLRHTFSNIAAANVDTDIWRPTTHMRCGFSAVMYAVSLVSVCAHRYVVEVSNTGTVRDVLHAVAKLAGLRVAPPASASQGGAAPPPASAPAPATTAGDAAATATASAPAAGPMTEDGGAPAAATAAAVAGQEGAALLPRVDEVMVCARVARGSGHMDEIEVFGDVRTRVGEVTPSESTYKREFLVVRVFFLFFLFLLQQSLQYLLQCSKESVLLLLRGCCSCWRAPSMCWSWVSLRLSSHLVWGSLHSACLSAACTCPGGCSGLPGCSVDVGGCTCSPTCSSCQPVLPR